MQIPKSELQNLEEHFSGRMKLHLFKEITTKENVYPTKQQGVDFINKLEEHIPFAELFTYILTDGKYIKLNCQNLDKVKNIDSLFFNLNKEPLSKSLLFEIRLVDGNSIGAWVRCDELADTEGYFYTVILCEENPQDIIFYAEFRTSQTNEEPSVVFHNQQMQAEIISKQKILSFDNEWILLCLKILNYVATKNVDTFLSFDKLKALKEKVSFSKDVVIDKKLERLIKGVSKGQLKCFETFIDIQRITPLSYNPFFNYSLQVISQAEKIIDGIAKQGILLYQEGESFIMSDDYLTYFILRKAGYKKVKAIIIAKKLPAGFDIIKKGSIELIPGFYSLYQPDYDILNISLRDQILQDFIDQLNTIKNLKGIITSKCIVLTEDSNTQFLEVILLSNGFNIDETKIYSYKNCTNLNSLDLTVNTFYNINPKVTIIIHRDRDYLLEKEIESIKQRIVNSNAIPFITTGTDVESYFINDEHIHSLYPNLSLERIQLLISEATSQTKEQSINNIKKHEHGEKYKNKTSLLDDLIEKVFDQNKERYRHGKTTLGVLINLLQKEIKCNPQIINSSEHINDKILSDLSKAIWKE